MRETADFDPEVFESRDAGDKTVYVKFYIRPVQDDAESAKAGRPIYKDREYVEIRTPGDQNNVIQRPVSDMDRQRFRGAYKAFKDGNEEQIIGTPLTEVPWITRSQVEELVHLRIRTLEHLAAVNDGLSAKIPGLYQLKDKAKAALATAEGQAPITELQKQLDEMRNHMESQQKTIAEQSEIIRKLSEQKSTQ